MFIVIGTIVLNHTIQHNAGASAHRAEVSAIVSARNKIYGDIDGLIVQKSTDESKDESSKDESSKDESSKDESSKDESSKEESKDESSKLPAHVKKAIETAQALGL